jgi:hypothetical protein
VTQALDEGRDDVEVFFARELFELAAQDFLGAPGAGEKPSYCADWLRGRDGGPRTGDRDAGGVGSAGTSGQGRSPLVRSLAPKRAVAPHTSPRDDSPPPSYTGRGSHPRSSIPRHPPTTYAPSERGVAIKHLHRRFFPGPRTHPRTTLAFRAPTRRAISESESPPFALSRRASARRMRSAFCWHALLQYRAWLLFP